MIKELIRLANHLDQKGLTKEADYLDNIIKKATITQTFKESMKKCNTDCEKCETKEEFEKCLESCGIKLLYTPSNQMFLSHESTSELISCDEVPDTHEHLNECLEKYCSKWVIEYD